MITYIVLASFTDQGIRNARDTIKRADAFEEMAKKFGVGLRRLRDGANIRFGRGCGGAMLA